QRYDLRYRSWGRRPLTPDIHCRDENHQYVDWGGTSVTGNNQRMRGSNIAQMLLRTLSLVETLGYNRSTFMGISIGQHLGSYEVTALLGKGGMGEVYRATDTKLNRDVAIKFLPAQFASNPDRMERFQREAYVLASLNHSNIAAIYGIEEADW